MGSYWVHIGACFLSPMSHQPGPPISQAGPATVVQCLWFHHPGPPSSSGCSRSPPGYPSHTHLCPGHDSPLKFTETTTNGHGKQKQSDNDTESQMSLNQNSFWVQFSHQGVDVQRFSTNMLLGAHSGFSMSNKDEPRSTSLVSFQRSIFVASHVFDLFDPNPLWLKIKTLVPWFSAPNTWRLCRVFQPLHIIPLW
jgi:hypothetical protein